MPGTSVTVWPPVRRAIRRATRSMYISSSFVRKIGSRATETIDATNAASSAHPKESTVIALGAMSEASLNIQASTKSTSRKPRTSVNGSRSAASNGGRIALSTAMIAAATNAPPQPCTVTPGTTAAAKRIAAAEMIHATSRRTGRMRGRSGSCVTS
jgi:hypothetical protein